MNMDAFVREGWLYAFISAVGVLALILSFFLNVDDKKMVIVCLFVVRLIPIVLSGFMSGAYISGDRIRANYSDSQGFVNRSRRGTGLFLFGSPLVVAAIAISFF